VAGAPGLFFVGLAFLYAASSSQIHGVERDAGRIVEAIAARSRATRPAAVRRPALQPAA
jgi:putative flavoprotein involved in K+ transport